MDRYSLKICILMFSIFITLDYMAGVDENCIFCSIIKKNENIIFQNDSFIVIKDIKPASKYHFLVISRRHITDAKHLTKDDKELFESMVDKAKSTLQEQENVDMNDIKLALHWPPFCSVKHLHLHAIAPASAMSFFMNLAFKTNTWWCVTPEYVLEQISN